MTSAWSQLEQMLTCAICLDKFKNPRLLPCQHSFCGDACMEGLVDYARRQIKCPECRAEHRIPYQGVSSLPSNVTLIRFLELHSRITGEEPEPVPTFMEKCSVCGEKVEGVQRCWHCEKKVCPECKEAHIDLLRREIGRLNGQGKRCLGKMQEFREVIEKAQERLAVQRATVKHEIEESCRRLIEDLQAKQTRLVEEVESFAEQEAKTLAKLKVALVDELACLESNARLADEKFAGAQKHAWSDQELSELKEVYAKAMEFVRLFEPEVGDYTRKMRFLLIPEFETLRRRICELGELKLGESADSLMAAALQHCNATGSVAMEICSAASAQAAAAAAAGGQGAAGYSLAHSNSNSQLAGSAMLELPSMQNALMRSQSDHRLASQFQARLKQQQAQQQLEANGKGGLSGSSRYAAANAGRDYETDSLRSRYAPTRTSNKDYANELLTRDWPRPSDNDDLASFGSSIHFKSAFMRRKEKERQQFGAASYSSNQYNNQDDDDDLISEASYGTGHSGAARNVRFFDPQGQQLDQARNSAAKLFDVPELEHAPLSGLPKLEGSLHLLERLHQMGARALVDKKLAEEEGKRDKDLVESARQAMSKARAQAQRQQSEDEVEKQKRANKQEPATQVQQQHQQQAPSAAAAAAAANQERERSSSSTLAEGARERSASARSDATIVSAPRAATPSSAPAAAQPAEPEEARGQQAQPATPPSPATSTSSSLPGARRSLYGAAVTEKSRRQLSNAIQDAAAYTRRRQAAASGSIDLDDATPEAATPTGSSSSTRAKRTLRSSGRSLSKQSSVEQTESGGQSSPSATQRRRRALARADSSQQSADNLSNQTTTTAINQSISESKNYSTGSGGHSDNQKHSSNQQESLAADRRKEEQQQSETEQQQRHSSRPANESHSAAHLDNQTSTTTDEDEQEDSARAARVQTPTSYSMATNYNRATYTRRRFSSSSSSSSSAEEPKGAQKPADEPKGADSDAESNGAHFSAGSGGARNAAKRASRELLPNAVNKLLDRSAQIRRDSQEQRSRGDSPQRSTQPSGSASGSQTSLRSSYYAAAAGARSSNAPSSSSYSAGASSAPSSAASRQRLAYQRSQSIRDSQQADELETTNSNNSIYTTASSSASHRRSSNEANELADSSAASSTTRRLSGNSTDRTLTSTGAESSPSQYASGRQSYRRDSSGDSAPAYQSRFLARSRTSAALSSSASQRSQDLDTGADSSSIGERPAESAARAYLSSRDRFMQSAGVMSASTRADSTGSGSYYASGSGSRSGSNTTNTTSAASAASHVAPLVNSMGQYRHHPSSQAYYNDNSPFIEFDDEDDQYSAYFPSGVKTHSEYLRNKFSRRTSSNSSSSSALIRSRSSHAPFTGRFSDDDDNDNSDIDESEKSYGASRVSKLASSSGSRRGSLASASFDSQTSGSLLPRSVYSTKRRMLFKLGSRGSDPGNFTWPRGVAVGLGSRGREIVVADSSNHRVQIFDSNGKFLNEFGSYGSAQGEFDCLAGVAINRVNKNYVVSDRYNHRIQVFDMEGRFVRSFGEQGREPGKFNLPWGVACDSSGLIYVCDKENHRIQVFDVDGIHLNKFGACGNQAGQLQHPHYIAAGSNKVVVTDTNNHRVQLFDSSGRLINSFGKEGSANGQFKFPRGVAMDDLGYIIVGDSGNNRLQIFNSEGAFIKSIGTWGSADGEFKGIEGVAVDAEYNILVCDRENHRIQVF